MVGSLRRESWETNGGIGARALVSEASSSGRRRNASSTRARFPGTSLTRPRSSSMPSSQTEIGREPELAERVIDRSTQSIGEPLGADQVPEPRFMRMNRLAIVGKSVQDAVAAIARAIVAQPRPRLGVGPAALGVGHPTAELAAAIRPPSRAAREGILPRSIHS